MQTPRLEGAHLKVQNKCQEGVMEALRPTVPLGECLIQREVVVGRGDIANPKPCGSTKSLAGPLWPCGVDV